ncbi:DUF4433 domain-containing protein [Shinella sp. CPCC 100929]|uniref:DUF4433 domain-containing protein n=1 Tax=Shinella lacus TaxID=2654216 RepID=A0ABT1RAX7_9HYPH|nr:DarT ssDNA thymidine ADP-ribosyltransferase family protein [Shinella lacus]MCQ4632224.1 DUF4433 domain-containing protein [Shinella lacus]
MLWFIAGFLVLCWLWHKIFGGRADAPSDTEKDDASAGVIISGRGVSRMMNEVGRSLSGIPEAVNRFNEIAAVLDAQDKEKKRKEQSSFGKTLRDRQLVIGAVRDIGKRERRIRKEMDTDPEFASLYESNKAELETILAGHAPPRKNPGRAGLVPVQYRTLRSWSIPFLVHFTRVSNLPSILANGIMPVAWHAKSGIVPAVNDVHRFDRRTNSSSFSIAHPNHRMLWKYRQLDPDEDWVILAVDPDVIWKKQCAFCARNAAEKSISSRSLGDLTGRAAFDKMLGVNRRTDALPYEPADDQAEVLIFGVVEPELITGAFFLKDETRAKLDGLCGARATFNAAESEALFSSRSHARRLTGNAALLDGYQKLMAQIADDLRQDPGLATYLDAALAEMLDNPDIYSA